MWDKILEFALSNGVVPLVMFFIGWLAGKYLKPIVHSSNETEQIAQAIATAIDRLTDGLVEAFPHSKIDDIVNEAVDKIIEKLDLKDADDIE